jgi:hypothetical protein
MDWKFGAIYTRRTTLNRASAWCRCTSADTHKLYDQELDKLKQKIQQDEVKLKKSEKLNKTKLI